MIKKFIKAIGPILLSALSITITFLLLQPLALKLGPSFNLLSNRGIGKVAFITLVILQIILFILTQTKEFLRNFFKINFHFFIEKNFVKSFFKYFFVFATLHTILLFIIYLSGYALYNPNWGHLALSLILKILFGFFVVFLLAWTEELIFRGTLFIYFEQHFSVFTSLFLTSTIFMFVHDLKNPLNLVTKNWKLGLGLFLLGALLNLIFINTRKLYNNMGAHAGLVFVKVLLRRAPLLIYLDVKNLPFWLNKDLRMSNLIHLLFLILIIYYLIKNRKRINHVHKQKQKIRTNSFEQQNEPGNYPLNFQDGKQL